MKAWRAGVSLAVLAAVVRWGVPGAGPGRAPDEPAPTVAPVVAVTPVALPALHELHGLAVSRTTAEAAPLGATPAALPAAPLAGQASAPPRGPALDRLIAAARQGDVRASHAVYRALTACADPDAAPCPGVPASLLQERRRFLAEAVRAGLPQAQVDFYVEGPSPVQAADENALQAWRAEALTALQGAVGQCDPFAAGLLATLHDSGELGPRDPNLAVAYAVAEGAWRHHPPADAALRDRLAEPISDTDLAAARQHGLTLAATCR